jgi:hypothetical protein
MASKKLSPVFKKSTWSPHVASLHRRRRGSNVNKKTLFGSLSDLGDDLPLPETSKVKEMAAAAAGSSLPKMKKEDRKKLSQDDIPMKVQRKLAIITDPERPMKERLELEVEMRNNEDESEILAVFKESFDRKKFLKTKQDVDREEEEQMERFHREEAVRAAKEKEEYSKVKLAEIEAEIEKQEREIKLKKEVELHKKKVVAKDAVLLRKNAEGAVAGVAGRKAKEKIEEQERQARLNKFRRKEGKTLTDVERVLKEAIIDQIDVSGNR